MFSALEFDELSRTSQIYNNNDNNSSFKIGKENEHDDTVRIFILTIMLPSLDPEANTATKYF